jgi:transposase
MQMEIAILGLDISKVKFDVALLINKKFKFKHFRNDKIGFDKLMLWLKNHEVSQLHACMEATGSYGEDLATFLHDQGFQISVVNPAQIKGFAQCELARNKTDKADAQLIARFCAAVKPSLWQPKPRHVRNLQHLVRRVDSLQAMRQQELNRKGTVGLQDISESIDVVTELLTEQIVISKKRIKEIIDENPDLSKKRELLGSIPGVSDVTASNVLAFFGEPKDFAKARQVAAFLGLNPRQYQSGSSVQGRTRISKTGDARLRKSLYMPALVAMKYNPTIKAFCEVLAKRGKAKKAIIVAAMRKLVHIIFGVLKSEKPYDVNWRNSNQSTLAA